MSETGIKYFRERSTGPRPPDRHICRQLNDLTEVEIKKKWDCPGHRYKKAPEQKYRTELYLHCGSSTAQRTFSISWSRSCWSQKLVLETECGPTWEWISPRCSWRWEWWCFCGLPGTPSGPHVEDSRRIPCDSQNQQPRIRPSQNLAVSLSLPALTPGGVEEAVERGSRKPSSPASGMHWTCWQSLGSGALRTHLFLLPFSFSFPQIN